jgi:hypothetical protein
MRRILPFLVVAMLGSGLGVAPRALVASSMSPVRPATQADSIRYVAQITDVNAVGMTLTNYGVIGNNFTTRSPSLEYPVGTGYEHLPDGGLWIGAHAQDATGAFVGVTTGRLDGTQGSGLQTTTEFTPAGLEIARRSRQPASPFYDPAATSDLDFLWTFSDRPAKSHSGGWPEDHRPLNVLVRAAAFAWGSNGLQDFVILRYTIINLGDFPLTNLWAGQWTQLASGPKSAYASWPPSSATGPGSWYSKKWLQYDATLRMIREHYCAAQPVPGGCNLGFVPAWMGIELLGASPNGIGEKQVTLAAWNWSPGNTVRDEDTERYAIMSAGTTQNLNAPDLMPQTGDPVELLAVGPFPNIAPGDSVRVDFAVVGGAEVADIQAHAAFAQQFYDSGFDIATPVQLALVHAAGNAGQASLMWYGSERGADVDVQRREESTDWQTIAHLASDGNGYISYEDRDVVAGTRYGYRLLASGEPFGEGWLLIPSAQRFSLSGVRPNPSPGRLIIAFTLPDTRPARIEVADVAGRRILARDVGSLGAGPHEVDMGDGRRVAAGVYLIRLTREGETLTTRAVVVH